MKLFDEVVFYILAHLFGKVGAETISNAFFPYIFISLSGIILFIQFIWPKINIVQEKLWLIAIVALLFLGVALAMF